MIASCFSLISFAAAIAVGLHAGNSASTILFRAICIMLACWVIGYAVGSIAQWVVLDHINRYKQQHPVPDESVPES